jgi:hypothetical protein
MHGEDTALGGLSSIMTTVSPKPPEARLPHIENKQEPCPLKHRLEGFSSTDAP